MNRILLAALTIAIVSCKDSPSIKNIETSKDKIVSQNQEVAIDAELFLETKCYTCHNPKATENEVMAPPMVAIKAQYLREHSSKKSFADAIWSFLEEPTKEKVQLNGALKRFGLMPYQKYSEKEIRLISNYIFDYQIEEPFWFKKHWENGHEEKNYYQTGKKIKHASNEDGNDQMEKGLLYAQSTQKVLGKNLMLNIQKNGVEAALEFCNERAYPLTDSMATVYNAKIKRVTDKPRNPKNQANNKELEYIDYFKTKIKNDESFEPILVKENDSTHFYSPIVTNTMCLNCHGIPKTNIKPNVSFSINKKYPYDKAIGYKENEVRGIWSISFKE